MWKLQTRFSAFPASWYTQGILPTNQVLSGDPNCIQYLPLQLCSPYETKALERLTTLQALYHIASEARKLPHPQDNPSTNGQRKWRNDVEITRSLTNGLASSDSERSSRALTLSLNRWWRRGNFLNTSANHAEPLTPYEPAAGRSCSMVTVFPATGWVGANFLENSASQSLPEAFLQL